MNALKAIMAIVGVVLIMMGGLWMLQGLDIVRWPASSFMLGDVTWTRNGAIVAAVGVLLIVLGRNR